MQRLIKWRKCDGLTVNSEFRHKHVRGYLSLSSKNAEMSALWWKRALKNSGQDWKVAKNRHSGLMRWNDMKMSRKSLGNFYICQFTLVVLWRNGYKELFVQWSGWNKGSVTVMTPNKGIFSYHPIFTENKVTLWKWKVRELQKLLNLAQFGENEILRIRELPNLTQNLITKRPIMDEISKK